MDYLVFLTNFFTWIMEVSVNTQLLEVVFPNLNVKYLCLSVCWHVFVSAFFAVNEKTTKVIEAAFQHARYPSVKREKSLLFIGRVVYGLDKWVDTYTCIHACTDGHKTLNHELFLHWPMQFGNSQSVDWSKCVWAACWWRHRHGNKQCVCSLQRDHPVWIWQLAVSLSVCDHKIITEIGLFT